MFNDLKHVLPKPAVENFVTAGLTDTAQPGPPAAPPLRFGAAKIVLAPDPSQGAITIIESQNLNNAHDYTVFINREINGDGNYYAELLTLLATLPENSQVVIYIGSPGGSLNGGAMIANGIRKCKATVTTVALGVVASAAALIWSYGDIRHAADGSVVMFHMSSHFDYGNSEAIRIQAENTVRYVNEVAIAPLVAEGLLTAEEQVIIVDQRREVWLDSATLNSRLEKLNEQAT